MTNAGCGSFTSGEHPCVQLKRPGISTLKEWIENASQSPLFLRYRQKISSGILVKFLRLLDSITGSHRSTTFVEEICIQTRLVEGTLVC